MKWQSASGRQYSQEELKAMQKDAMDRVREMQRRADETLRRSNAPLSVQETAEAEPPVVSCEAPSPCPQPEPPSASTGKLSQILSAAGMDQDRLILLGLLLLLYNDGADQLLLLALLYLFL